MIRNDPYPHRPATVKDGVQPPAFSLTQEDVRECGIEFDDAGAWNRATELVSLFRMLLGPIPEDPSLEAGSNIVALASFKPGKLR